jgi:uroporphyrin-III C-methyltransferase / precorrin-2 dehydrogenase / sirohydrochlorin ferrochelatase
MVAAGDAPYMLALRLAGRRVTIIGGGAVAARRIPPLLESGGAVVVISPALNPALAEFAAAGQISWTQRRYSPGDCAGAWLVGAFTGDPDVNSAVAQEAEAGGIWCVRADDAAASTAWTPASGRAAGVQVAVLSGDPRHSAGVRDAMLGGLTSGAIAARRGRGPQGQELRGTVALIGGGPGDPGLITVRGRELLAEADVVVADRLAPRSLLAELPGDVEIVDAAKVPRGRAVAQDHINALLVANARAGRFVARLKGGDPFLFGRGAEEVLACLRAGITVTVVPGVSSVAAVPASAGIPLTHRGIAQEFHVASGHVAPGDARSSVNWQALASSAATLVLLMATEHLEAIAGTLIRYGRHSGTPVSVIADGTLPTRRTINTRLGTVARDVARAAIGPPAVVVVGEVVTVSEQISELCGGLAEAAPWGMFVPSTWQGHGITASRGSGAHTKEEGPGTDSSPAPGAAAND